MMNPVYIGCDRVMIASQTTFVGPTSSIEEFIVKVLIFCLKPGGFYGCLNYFVQDVAAAISAASSWHTPAISTLDSAHSIKIEHNVSMLCVGIIV